MKRQLTTLLCLAGLTTTSFAQTLWTGATDNDFNTDSNWTNDLPNNTDNPGTINSGTPVLDVPINMNITQNGGDVGISGQRRLDGGTWDLLGGSLGTPSGGTTNRFILSGEDASNATLNINGGTLTNGADFRSENVSFINILTDVNIGTGAFDLREGIMTIDDASFTNTGTFNFSINSIDDPLEVNLLNGALFDVGTLQYGASPGTNFGQVTFGGTGISTFVADTWNSNRQQEWNIDFLSSASGSTFTIDTDFNSEAQWITAWDEQRLTVDGGNAGEFSDYFTVTGGTLTFMATAIPEPSTAAILGTGLVLLGLRRRQQRGRVSS